MKERISPPLVKLIGTGGAMAAALVAMLTFWAGYGWPTQTSFNAHVANFDTHVALLDAAGGTGAINALGGRVDAVEAMAGEVRDQVKAWTFIDRIIRGLLREECMGATGVRPAINARKREFRELTGEDYEEPTCQQIGAGD